MPTTKQHCPRCGHEEIKIEVVKTLVVPFQKKIKVDRFHPARKIRKACCAECGFNIRELVAIS